MVWKAQKIKKSCLVKANCERECVKCDVTNPESFAEMAPKKIEKTMMSKRRYYY